MEGFKDRLYSLRVSQGMSQYEFSRTLGVSRESYHHYEDGTRTPNVDFLKKLCEVYHVAPSWMLGLDGESGKISNATNKVTNKAVREIETAMDACAAALTLLKVKYEPF